jgi:DNA-directed RNA polymerase subunit omega
MARITSELAVEKVGNRFDLVLIATVRARELKKGHIPLTTRKGGATITALREIEEGKIGREYLEKIRKDNNRGMERR